MFSEILTQMLWQEPDKTLLQEVMRLDLPMCNQIRRDLLDGVAFPLLGANVMYGVLSKRLHQSDAGTDLYVGDDVREPPTPSQCHACIRVQASSCA